MVDGGLFHTCRALCDAENKGKRGREVDPLQSRLTGDVYLISSQDSWDGTHTQDGRGVQTLTQETMPFWTLTQMVFFPFPPEM